jgi:hypothetical protein
MLQIIARLPPTGSYRIGCTTDPVLIPYKSLVLKIRSGTALMMAMIGRQNQGT